MIHSQAWARRLPLILSLGLILSLATTMGTRTTVLAQDQTPTATPSATQTTTYTVQAGDTLTRIANRYGVTVQQLVALNNIANPDLIPVGQVLAIPATAGATATPVPVETAVTPTATATPAATVTYTVQTGDTLTRIANRYGTTVQELVALNHIANPNLIPVGQVLAIPATAGATATPVPVGTAVTPTPQPAAGGPLSLTWALVSWKPDDPNYIGTLHITAQGGTPPYTYYHDGLVQAGDTFDMSWKRCENKPGSVGVADATGLYVKQDYWLPAPYCPLGIEIVEPAADAQLKNMPRNFNITWEYTVNPPPDGFGIEIQVWENGGWQAWKEYQQGRGGRPLFFVPDVFPGDLAGRLRMWGIYGDNQAGPKTDWRNFEFRVTY
jgi:LysM repeat protein